MHSGSLDSSASRYLHELCVNIPSRRVGSQGNQQATAFFKSALQHLNLGLNPSLLIALISAWGRSA